MKYNIVPTFAVDGNLLIRLALVRDWDFETLKKQLKCSSHLKELAWFDGLVRQGKVRLVVLPGAYEQMITMLRKPDYIKDEQAHARVVEKQLLAKKALAYIEKNEAVKKVFINNKNKWHFSALTKYVAEFYSEDPRWPEDLTRSAENRQAPFLTKSFGPTKEACVMAEATILGLDLLTYNVRIVGTRGFDMPAAIQKINECYMASGVRPYHFYDVVEKLGWGRAEQVEQDAWFMQPKHRRLVPYTKVLSHWDYVILNHRNLKQRNGELWTQADDGRRYNLFKNFMEQPLELKNLEKYAWADKAQEIGK